MKRLMIPALALVALIAAAAAMAWPPSISRMSPKVILAGGQGRACPMIPVIQRGGLA